MNAADDPAMMDLLVEVSDTLVADLETDALLQWVTERGVQLLSAQVAGIVLADARGVLRLLAAAPEYTEQAKLFEAPSAPPHWCFATGETLVDADLDDPDPRWAVFAEQARADGFRSVAAVPMRIRGEIIGTFSVLRDRAGPFSAEQLRLTQALANLATVGLLVKRDTGYRTVLAARSQHILMGRVAVERARGILAELLDTDTDTALQELRRHAMRTERELRATAIEVVRRLPTAGRGISTVPVLLVQAITMTSPLAPLRDLVRQRLSTGGLSGSALDSFLLAIHEAAVNAQQHAGGGWLWLWRHNGSVWCEISDRGPGLPAGFTIPDGSQDIRRQHAGLWLIRRICPDLRMTSSTSGTRLLLRRSLPAHSSGSPFADSGAAG
ncbi:GAF domain-containing protein [Actinoplanes sp. NPDC049681]|uniref:GAF domain-containing protein n=1 Tax=Actinoplanes sp. NPDC049681 TaxID=3363905 RepID=UPI0037A8F0CB